MADLEQCIHARTARGAIMGQGYIGLSLAVEFTEAGFQLFSLPPGTLWVGEGEDGGGTFWAISCMLPVEE